jgi:GNAT superfamily N-acetyltransferase
MKLVKTSEIKNILTIPALGEYSNGTKFKNGTDLFFKKLNGKYKAVPVDMNYAMILEYVGDNWVIQLANSNDYENIYLSAINVKDKGKGIGTDLMNRILDYCDDNGYKLYLHPFPLDYSGIKFNYKNALNEFYKLRDWYKSFNMIEQSDGYMVYTPNLESF